MVSLSNQKQQKKQAYKLLVNSPMGNIMLKRLFRKIQVCSIMENKIEIYLTKIFIEIKVKIEQATVWLDAHLIARLFNVNRPAIVKHIQTVPFWYKLL